MNVLFFLMALSLDSRYWSDTNLRIYHSISDDKIIGSFFGKWKYLDLWKMPCRQPSIGIKIMEMSDENQTLQNAQLSFTEAPVISDFNSLLHYVLFATEYLWGPIGLKSHMWVHKDLWHRLLFFLCVNLLSINCLNKNFNLYN